MTELKPITPREAADLYLEAREQELSKTTLREYRYRINHFVRWCRDNDIDNLNDVTGRQLLKFKTWREDDGDLKPITVESDLDALRLFFRWATTIDAVDQDLHETVDALKPKLSRSDEQADSILTPEEAEDLIQYQRKFDYASRRHVIVELLWHTGIRLGALRALDVDDYDGVENRLAVRHRPGTETPLKNDERGERLISLSPDVSSVIDDYIGHTRHDVTDDHGRHPLVTTKHGRIGTSSVRHTIYEVTRPCYYDDECPADRVPEDCEATTYKYYHRCPANVSPHDVRRGSITHFLMNDVPEPVVSDRMNVSREVLDKHYDKRSEEVKVEQRREYINDV